VGQAALDAIDDDVRADVAAAEAEARAAPEPASDVLETQVWADGSSAWRN
jgi:acetoin:2,6-dichlorophenolindophenol oxidoreductase subunit alpha